MREDKIKAAAEFLNSQQVSSSDDETKRLFLNKKGLSNQEIEAAFRIAGGAGSFQDEVPLGHLTVPVNHQLLGAAQFTPHHAWGFNTLKNLFNLSVFATAAVYGIRHLYKRYMKPWLTGVPADEPIEIQLLKLQATIAESLIQLRTTVDSMQVAVNNYNKTIQANNQSADTKVCPKQLEQIREEMALIKSLLLNKRNFPVVPGVALNIPAWQKTDSEKPNHLDVSLLTSSTDGSSNSQLTTEEANSNLTKKSLDGPDASGSTLDNSQYAEETE